MIEWLFLTLLFVAIQGLFALFEMGCVSYNRIRLQYDVNEGDRKAGWIDWLLKRPSRLFGTTLIGLNAALQIGSECARRFYESIHLDPDFAPISQVIIVLIFGELIPMFAARRYPRKASRALSPMIIFLARLFSPFTWAFGQIARLIHWMMGRPIESPLFLNREEVRLAFEERKGAEEEWADVVNALFQLKNQTAGELMIPLSQASLFPSQTTVQEVREAFSKKFSPILPIYHRTPQNIVALASARDLIPLADTDPIFDKAGPSWFVTKDTSVLRLLDQFRRNNQSAAIILDSSGGACGILTLDQIIDTILGPEGQEIEEEHTTFVHRTLPGSMSIADFNRQFQASLPGSGTLSDFLLTQFEHSPSKGESVEVGQYEFTVLEPSLRGVKTVSVKSL